MTGKVLIKGKNPIGTRIFIDGNEIDRVRAFHCSQSVDEVMTLTLEIIPSEIEIEGDNVEVTNLKDNFRMCRRAVLDKSGQPTGEFVEKCGA